jgi:hypothetical protein
MVSTWLSFAQFWMVVGRKQRLQEACEKIFTPKCARMPRIILQLIANTKLPILWVVTRFEGTD